MDSGTERLRALVEADLARLRVTWDEGAVTEDAIRYESGVLRRLLVDNGSGTLGRLRKATRKPEPRIEAIDLARAYPKGSDVGASVLLASGGTLRQGGATVLMGPMMVSTKPLPAPRRLEPARLRLSEFGDSICAIIEGRRIKRRELIKYVTNKLGGVHYDDVRRPEEHATEIALDSLGHRPRPNELVLHVGGSNDDAGIPLVFFELLSIGQALIASADVHSLTRVD